MLKIAWRFLGSHNLALTLIGGLAVSVLAGGTLPQASRLSSGELLAFRNEWQTLAPWADYFGLTAIFSSDWFLVICIALLVNMTAGLTISLKRRIGWLNGSVPPRFHLQGSGHLPCAPDFLFGKADGKVPQRVVRCQGWLGLWGSTLFHLGIAVIVVGGIWSSLAGFSAHLELSEGEVYSGQPGKLVTERGDIGTLSDFRARLRLDHLRLEVSEDNHLRELQGHVSIQQEGGEVREEVVETNHPLLFDGYRLYPNNTFGFSAVFDRIGRDGERRRLYIHFPVTVSEWDSPPPLVRSILVELQDTALYYDMTLTKNREPVLDLVVHDSTTEVFNGKLVPGTMADLKAYKLVFLGTVGWMGFYLASDRPMLVVFSGVILGLLGFLLHLSFQFRRAELMLTEAGWEVKIWCLSRDWRLEEQWQSWKRKTLSAE